MYTECEIVKFLGKELEVSSITGDKKIMEVWSQSWKALYWRIKSNTKLNHA